MSEESKVLATFMVGPLSFYKCEHMPFRLTNMPTTFQCLMEICLRECQLIWYIMYLDDIVVFTETPWEHLWQLWAMFLQLRKAGLKIKPNKCEFLHTEIAYQDYIVPQEGVRMDRWKIKAIHNWPQPNTVTDVCSFLGFTNYYQ